MICVKAAFFPQMGTGSIVVRVCSSCACIFGSTSLRAVCSRHDVQLLTSSDHMKHPCLSDLLAVLLLSSRIFFFPMLPTEGAVSWGRARSPTLNRWTSKGRHKLAHIWGQNRSPFIQPL